MKELYIAPEVEILCFMPVENLANGFWNTWSLTGDENGNGQLGPNASTDGAFEGGGSSGDGDGDED